MDERRSAFLMNDFRCNFITFCGIESVNAEEGRFESTLVVLPEHLQQDGYVHAGVLATIADHTAGYAAYTTVEPPHRILTVEFKINYMKPAIGERIVCRAQVLNNGKTIKVVESSVYVRSGDHEKLTAKGMFTQIAVER